MAKLTKAQKEILQTICLPPFTKEQEDRFKLIDKHLPESGHPHWSLEVKNWPKDRWDPMSNAPKGGMKIRIRYMEAKYHGSEYHRQSYNIQASGMRYAEYAHYAEGGGDEQPYFKGWFNEVNSVNGFVEIPSVEQYMEWQPLWADDNMTYALYEEHNAKVHDLIAKIQTMNPNDLADQLLKTQPLSAICKTLGVILKM